MKKLLLVSALTLILGAALHPAKAQNTRSSMRNDGVLPLPPEVSTVLSIDAHNSVIIGTRDPKDTSDAPEKFTPYSPRHIYSGVLGRLFGGAITTTEEFVIPESALQSGGGALGTGGRSSQFGNQGFGNQGFGNQGFSGQNTRTFNRGFSTMVPQ